MILYHGSSYKIPKPLFGKGKTDNDYGQGFYTTTDYKKASEWAIANGTEASIVNKYEIDLDNLNVISLDNYGILTWIAEIIDNRGVRGEASELLGEKIIEKYKIDLSSADVVVGYRADDSYMDIIDAFLQNQLDIDEVERLFKKGELGLQYFIKSEKAFDALQFKGFDIIDEQNFNNQDEINARIAVSKFLKQRSNQILLNGFYPSGITARDAAKNIYDYNKDYEYYELIENEKEGEYDDI